MKSKPAMSHVLRETQGADGQIGATPGTNPKNGMPRAIIRTRPRMMPVFRVSQQVGETQQADGQIGAKGLVNPRAGMPRAIIEGPCLR